MSEKRSVADAERYLFELSQMGEPGKFTRLEQNQLDSIYASLDALRDERYRLENKLRATEGERDTLDHALTGMETDRDAMKALYDKAQGERDEIAEDRDSERRRADMHSHINQETSIALGMVLGESWTTIPERVEALRARVEELEAHNEKLRWALLEMGDSAIDAGAKGMRIDAALKQARAALAKPQGGG